MRKHFSNNNLEFEVLEEFSGYSNKRAHVFWLIQFKDTGTTMQVLKANAIKGKVKDPYAVSVWGVGYVGFFSRKLPYWKQANQLWRNMMKRCYCEKDPRGYFGTAFVDSRWKCFANFLEDLPKLDNFEKWLDGFISGVKYNLDKDLKVEGNKLYSREVCSFVLESVNKSEGAKNGKPFTKKSRPVSG